MWHAELFLQPHGSMNNTRLPQLSAWNHAGFVGWQNSAPPRFGSNFLSLVKLLTFLLCQNQTLFHFLLVSYNLPLTRFYGNLSLTHLSVGEGPAFPCPQCSVYSPAINADWIVPGFFFFFFLRDVDVNKVQHFCRTAQF